MVVLAIISFTIVYLYYKRCRFKFPFKDTMGESGLPIVSFEQNGKTFNFLLDSGADNSVLDTSSLTKLNYVKLEGNRCVYGIDSNPVQTSFVGVKLFSRNHRFIEVFQVFDVYALKKIADEHNIEVVGVLGSAFLRKYGFLIDYKQLKAYTNGKEDKVANT